MFHAPRQATVDLALGGAAHAQPSEFASLPATAAPLLGPLRPAELEESKEHADISFLTGETGISQQHLAFWAVAARLSATSELPAELFYGLFRAGVPADANVAVLASSTQGVDLEANAQRLLQGVLSTSAASVTAAVQSVVESNLIPASYAERALADLGRLTELASHNALTSTQGFGKTSFGSVLDTLAVEPSVQERFIALYTAAAGTARSSFWSDLAMNPAFTTAQVADLRFGVIVGRLTRGYLPLITELAAQRSAGQISGVPDLARLTAADWARLLQQGQNGQLIGAPTFIDAPTPQLAVQTYATMLERFFTRAYPTTAFAARAAADSGGPFTAAGATASFLDANPKFDLRYTNIDAYAATTEISADIRPTLLAAQRLVKVNSTYSVMSALMADGVQSAHQVYSMGRDRFIAKYGQLPALGATEAARTWVQAEQTYAVALAVATKFNATLSATSPAAAAIVLPQDVQTQVAAFPNLQTLFGSVSMCACQDCQSVLGDAAYLVDTLDFLAQRSASGGQSVRDELLKRRPDIAQIQLSCPNTDTALPYIDLVNELLEDTVAPAGPADPTYMPNRQTTLSTPELDANPEYVNQAAYNTLSTTVYPWTLPFDYALAETRTYLGQLNLSRAQLIRTFQAPGGYPSPQADALAREALGLSELQADIITGGPLAAGYQSWDYWGLQQAANTITDPADPTKTVTGTWIDVLSQVRVLLARASLDYTDLARLLNTVFINADGAVTITASPPDSCDVNTMTLSGLTQDVLDRLHRFVRLWRCLGWDPYDLDNAITTMQSTTAPGLPQLSPQFLRQTACAAAAMTAYSLPVASDVALFAPAPTAATIATRDIPTLPGDDERYSLYHDLFENLTVLNPPDPVFMLNASGTEIAAIASAPQLSDHSAALTAALGISASDLALAIASFTDGSLTLANLCALYRHTVLATALGVTITELITLLAIIEAPTAAAPYHEVVQPFDGTRPESLAAFAATYATITADGLSIEQADYILRNADAANRMAPDPVAVGTVLLTLYNGLVKIAAELAFSADPTGQATGKELAKFLSAADVSAVMAILAGSSTLSGSDQDNLIGAALGPYMNAAAAQASLAGGAALPAGEARFGYVLQNMLAYETQTRSAGLVVQTLAQALGLATATASLLLTEWFPSASTPGSFLITDFLAIANAALADTTDPVPPSNPAFAPLFTAYAALTKTALIITSLNLSTTDVRWWHDSGVAAGWLDPTTLPSTLQAAADGRCYRLCRLHQRHHGPQQDPGSGRHLRHIVWRRIRGHEERLPQWPCRHDPMADRNARGALRRPGQPSRPG